MSGIGRSVDTTVLTGNQNIDGLLGDVHWSSTSLNYSFPTSSFEYDVFYTSGAPTNNFTSVASAQQAATHFGLDSDIGSAASAGFSVEGFTNLNISLTTGPKAAIRLAQSNTPSTAFAFFPGSGYDEAGDVWFGTQYAGTIYDLRNPEAGNYAWHTLIHELGHALGLEHGHEGGAAGPVPAAFDALEFTVMTYRTYVNGPLNGYSYEEYGAPQTFMMLDIAALQELYGADYTTNSGDTVYAWNPSSGQTFVDGVAAITPGANRIFATIWDGGGTDTYDLSAYTTDLTIDLSPGESSIFSAAQLAYLGGGNQYASGNIYNALMHDNDTRSLIENAIGGSGDDTIVGNQVANELRGNAGDDTLDGGSGNDTLDGGSGGDTLDGGSNGLVGDTVTYANSNGAVNVRLFQDTATGGHANGDELDNIENLIGSVHNDILFGDVQDNDLQGGDGDDNLNGSNGDDTLNGGADDDRLTGGQGADDLDGGDGTGDEARYATSNEAVVIDLAADTATGGHADGDELDNIENLFGSGFGDTLTGDSQDNRLDGFNGNDTLVGGDGADFLFGGTGSDTADYTDSGMTAVTVKLNTFSGVGGTAEGDELRAIENVIGSAAGDTINGSTGTNTLTGAGGDDTLNGLNGNDFLYGGDNDDTLIGGRGGDLIDGGDGIDTARYANSDGLIRIDLGAGTTGGAGHAFNDTLVDIENIFGSAFNDVITGDDGVNDLNGYNGNDRLNGGLGDDVLTGGFGADRFIFTDVSFGQDTITDFANNQDKLDFTALGLTASDFTITQVGNDTLMTLNSDTNQTIALEDTTATTIDNGDFF